MGWLSFLGVTNDNGRIFGVPRSWQWPRVRAEWLETHDSCAVCGTNKELQVHHVHPYHLQPTMELDAHNLITLCEHNRCHLAFGHLYDWRSWNPDVVRDATIWRTKIRHRLQA